MSTSVILLFLVIGIWDLVTSDLWRKGPVIVVSGVSLAHVSPNAINEVRHCVGGVFDGSIPCRIAIPSYKVSHVCTLSTWQTMLLIVYSQLRLVSFQAHFRHPKAGQVQLHLFHERYWGLTLAKPHQNTGVDMLCSVLQAALLDLWYLDWCEVFELVVEAWFSDCCEIDARS